MRVSILAGCIAATAACATTVSAFELQPLNSFGTGGWLAPGSRAYIPAAPGDNNQRGMVYSAVNNRVYIVNRTGGVSVNIMDGTTGADLGSLDVTGVTGGTFAANMIGVGDDGAIYVGNLQAAAGTNFKIYRWANDAAAPTVAFDGLTSLGRTGDTFAVIGSGANTRIIASGSGHNAIALFDTADGSSYTLTSANAMAGAPAGAYRLGLAFVDPNNAIGKQTGATLYTADLVGNTGAAFATNSAGEAPLAYYGPEQLLATVDINSNDVRLYDASDLSVLTSTGFLDLANNTTAHNPNVNGVGDLSFGVGPDGTLRLYALNTNNGIQAFVVIPEPASLGLLGLGSAMLLGRRRSR